VGRTGEGVGADGGGGWSGRTGGVERTGEGGGWGGRMGVERTRVGNGGERWSGRGNAEGSGGRGTAYNCGHIFSGSRNIIAYSCRGLHYLSMDTKKSFFELHMNF
jgi:hypothetical protein